MRYCILILFLNFSGLNATLSQSFDKEKLSNIAKQEKGYAERRADRIQSYLSQNTNESKVLYSDDIGQNIVVMYDVRNGLPIYKTIHNEQARLTTGVDFVQSDEGLNLPLFGQNLTIGVWDGGLVLNTHQEFGGRIKNKLGSEYSNHATHVTGTIAASGVDQRAKGMLPQVKIHSYYAFDNDLGPMATEAANGLILSNHSYGLVLGWRFNPSTSSWNWLGGSDDVDATFGSYSSNSRTIDNIAYNAPYYTIVWSAGNDRSDIGDGSRPPDGPFDIIGPSAGSKNIITVGAITGFDEYVDENSPEMSTFSSWGPTNDGRIKPDVVADGVGVYSTGSAGNSSYVTLQGTSMSAPNATGTFGLIQQYYRSKNDTFMTAAQLKSLVIHTAREAGANKGPDYKFGWGVVNAVGAINMITGMESEDTVLASRSLLNGDSHVFEIYSDGKSPINATIAWTDVAGIVREETSTLPNLVNDLDIRLLDDLNRGTLPWTLDASNTGKAAVRANNSLDNVEKVELQNPEARRYRLVIDHKGTLVNDKQSYAISISYKKADVSNSLSYWVNGNGSFTSSNNFSLTSGGANSDFDFNEIGTLVIDENSFSSDGTILLESDVTLKNLIFTSDDIVTIDLGGNVMYVSSPLYLNNNNLKIENGTLNMINSVDQSIALNFEGMENLTVELTQKAGIGKLETELNIERLRLLEGTFELKNQNISVNNLDIETGSELIFENNIIFLQGTLALKGNILSKNNTWYMKDGNMTGTKDILLEDRIYLSGTTLIKSKLISSSLHIEGNLTVQNGLVADSIILSINSNVVFFGQDSIEINKYLDLSESFDGLITIFGDEIEPSVVVYKNREKLCVGNIKISNINFNSQSVLNVGSESTLSNTTNIFQQDCNELLFADFQVTGNCSNSLIFLKDLSSGNFSSLKWEVAGVEHFSENVTSANPVIWFNSPGEHEVVLTISNDSHTESHSKIIFVSENELAETKIIENDQGLVASANVSLYQWFFNGEIIENATARVLAKPLEVGSYNVAYFKDSNCNNRVSEVYDINTVTRIGDLIESNPIVFPNPFKDLLMIENLEVGDKLIITDLQGKYILKKTVSSNNELIHFEHNQNQFLIVKIQRKNKIFSQKLLQLQ